MDQREMTEFRKILEEATDIAARAFALCLARAIDSYVPRSFADHIKARMALELLAQVDARYPRPSYATEH